MTGGLGDPSRERARGRVDALGRVAAGRSPAARRRARRAPRRGAARARSASPARRRARRPWRRRRAPCSTGCSKSAPTAASRCPSIRAPPWSCCRSTEHRNGSPPPGRAGPGHAAPPQAESPDGRLKYPPRPQVAPEPPLLGRVGASAPLLRAGSSSSPAQPATPSRAAASCASGRRRRHLRPRRHADPPHHRSAARRPASAVRSDQGAATAASGNVSCEATRPTSLP